MSFLTHRVVAADSQISTSDTAPTRLQLPARLIPLVFSITMSLTVTACVSALLVTVNSGVDSGLPLRWLRSWAMAWAVAFPLVYLLSPRVRAFLTRRAR